MQLPFKPNPLQDQLPNFRLMLRAINREFRLGMAVTEDVTGRVIQAYNPEEYAVSVQRHGLFKTIAFCKGVAPLALLIIKEKSPATLCVVNASAVYDLVNVLLKGRNLLSFHHFENRARIVQSDSGACPPVKPSVYAFGFSTAKATTFAPDTSVDELRKKQKVGSFYCYSAGKAYPVLGLSECGSDHGGEVIAAVGGGDFREVCTSALLWVNLRAEMMPEGFDPTVQLETFMAPGERWVPINITQRGVDDKHAYWVLDVIQFHKNRVRPSYLQVFCAKSPHRELSLGVGFEQSGLFEQNAQLLANLRVRYLESLPYTE